LSETGCTLFEIGIHLYTALNRREKSGAGMSKPGEILKRVGAFCGGMWRYWRSGEPAPESNYVVQKLYAYTDGRSNDFLFRILESRRREADVGLGWEGTSLLRDGRSLKPNTGEIIRTLKEDGVVVLPVRLKKETIENLYELAVSCRLETGTYRPPAASEAPGTLTTTRIAQTGTSQGMNPCEPRHAVYTVPRSLLLENESVQALLCDPYVLAIAAGYLGVFPVVTKPDMWWDTDFVPEGLRPRPFHTDSGCLRWLKVGINLTDTTVESPHFVYVKGSHNPNRETRPLTRRLASRMNLSDREVRDVCAEKIIHLTAPAGSVTLADTRGIHKGEIAERGNRLILYFGLEGSAFNNIDQPMPLNHVGSELAEAMNARPFSYQFFSRQNGAGGFRKAV
jgi:hypothetical protein